jgi:23S rRNA (adenine2030-N6)-methyltransferase
MLSYRHGFHAGNFADVLKHTVLTTILTYLKKKDTPLCYIDTHAGAGKYSLHSDYALKNREFDNGIGKLWLRTDLPDTLANYVALVKKLNPSGTLNYYPGSPWLAHQLLHAHDPLFLYELHSTESQTLRTQFKAIKRAKVFQEDGLKNSLNLLPPVQHRGFILIDPAYEQQQEYSQVIKTLIAMTKRFATGTYALWYPVIDRNRSQRMEQALIASGIKNIQLFEVGIDADNSGYGMTASGMIVINPPWTLVNAMQTCLPYLATVLGENNQGFYQIKTLVQQD